MLPASWPEVAESSLQPGLWGRKIMEIQEMGRTVRPDSEAIKRLRVAKGWSVEVLADKAICSPKTVQNIETGKRVYLSTLSKIAAPPALNVEVMTLVEGGKPPPEPPKPPKSPPCVQFQLVVSIPFDQFDESEQLGGFIEFLKKFMRGGGDIDVVGVTPGSTIITVAASIDDMLALYSALQAGKLAEVQVVELRPLINTDPVHPGYKTYDPTLDTKSSLTGGTSKDFTQSKIEPPEQKDKKHKPDTKT
jgi:hypothetical protein